MSTLGSLLLVSGMAGLATTAGALAVLLWGHLGRRSLSALLGFASGVMVAVVAFDLWPTAWRWGGAMVCFWGAVAGVLLLMVADWGLSYRSGGESSTGQDLRRMGILIAVGISLHDFPEGMAIAAGAAAEAHLGWLVALAIGLHNIPEGIATALPLRMSLMPRRQILGLTTVMACFTPLGTLLGYGMLKIRPDGIALLLALAGGAMAYLVVGELWPQARREHRRWALAGGAMGCVGMVLATMMH
ncbi:ZIP family metal transporter [Heliophilum fasciatum]|uniref:ZIP family zinc transporter n=1 Tax=Heliophilum fasciatum TaxID=35700 RepID=A0A4R2S4I8_9FIRM|nr:ZIP family metal transporter [Heliophilum fasciatum]MCW2277435.1 ZIP family zinc transporter [Heliophilum fasciatum]TCP67271.1 ZIP family zinc transporter [Heliophilum fasciatum]